MKTNNNKKHENYKNASHSLSLSEGSFPTRIEKVSLCKNRYRCIPSPFYRDFSPWSSFGRNRKNPAIPHDSRRCFKLHDNFLYFKGALFQLNTFKFHLTYFLFSDYFFFVFYFLNNSATEIIVPELLQKQHVKVIFLSKKNSSQKQHKNISLIYLYRLM